MASLTARVERLPIAAGVICTAAAVAVAGLGTVSPRLLIVTLAAIGLVALTVTHLTLGLTAFILLTFFERAPGLDSVTITKPLGAVLLLSLLITWTRDRESMPALPRDRPFMAFLLTSFVVVAVASTAWAKDPGATIAGSFRLALTATLFVIVFSAVRCARDLRMLAWAYVLGAFLVAAAALMAGEWMEGRLTSGALDPNFLAATLVSSSVVAMFMLVGATRFQQLILLGTTATAVVAVVLTQSRGGIIAAGTAFMAAIAFGGRWRARAVAVALIVASMGITYYAVLAPTAVRDRVTNITPDGSTSRTDTWNIAWHAALDHPLGGIGLANFPVVARDYASEGINLQRAGFVLNNELVVHNTYIEILSELGLVGAALFAGIVVASFQAGVEGLRLLGTRHAGTEALMRGLLAGTVSLFAAYVFLSAQYEKHLWLLLGLFATFPTVARTIEREAR